MKLMNLSGIRCALLLLALTGSYTSARGELLIVFTPTANGFTVVASGEVDTEGLTYCRVFSADLGEFQGLDRFQTIRRVGVADAIYDFPQLVRLFDPTEDTFGAAEEVSGDDFGMYVDPRESLIYFDADFVRGRIDGSMTFEGFDLAALNPIPQRLSWGAGPDQAVRIAIGPIPQSPSFEVTAISRNSSGHVSITWGSEIGSNYQVEHSPSMRDGSWSEVSEVLPGLANSMSFNHTGAAGEEMGFYRVVRTPP